MSMRDQVPWMGWIMDGMGWIMDGMGWIMDGMGWDEMICIPGSDGNKSCGP
jgi:hypothetical protein